MTSPRPLEPLALAVAVLSLLLAGCGGPADPEPTDPAIFPTFTAPEVTPSPTPTGPQPAAYDQYWTENQLAAVQVVERHKSAFASIERGETIQGDVIDLDPLWQVSSGVEWEEGGQILRDELSTGELITGEGVFVSIDPGYETTTADGLQQIVVWTCYDPSPTRVIGPDGQDITPENRSRGAQNYTVQYLPERQSWLVILVRDSEATC